ncbi:hypothetical protein U1Q18_045704, partial [Sarracenia purpurea var. burkii]
SIKDLAVKAKESLEDTIPSPALPTSEKTTGIRDSCSPLESQPSSPEAQSSSAFPPLLDLSTLSITASNKEKTTEMQSYLIGNRVRVYTCIPEIAFPRGTVLLPIDHCRWVAVSLEFPTEES